MKLRDAPTPAAVIDVDRLRRNVRFMTERARNGGVALRPHMKTAKSIDVAQLALQDNFGGVTVSTLAEAEYFFERGIRDLTYAVCITPDRIPRAAALINAGASLHLITDSVAVAEMLTASRAPLSVLIEVDCGEHRTGVPCESDALTAIGRILHRGANTTLAGVLTHGGHAYACSTVDEIRRVAEQERQAVVRAAERLRSAGVPCPTVSAGSTPTAVHAPSFEGLTELRPGVYMFFDLAQLSLQSCGADDIALTVLSTVLSHRPENGRLVIDAGGLALSKDTGANRLLPDAGYGWLVGAEDQTRIGNLRVVTADQEHGYVEDSGPLADDAFDRLPIGSRVRVLPNHACMTAACFDEYLIVSGGEVIDRWPRLNGWG